MTYGPTPLGAIPVPPNAAPLTRAQAIEVAQQMRSAGWQVVQIRGYLEARGVPASRTTVGRWSDPAALERHTLLNRQRLRTIRAERRAGRLGRSDTTTDLKLHRMIALDRAGLTANAIRKVMDLDFGDTMTVTQVRKAIQTNTYPPGFDGGRCREDAAS